jgi:hypothetical protein
MRRLILIAVLCAVPLTTFSHPGKTDRHGGHKCQKRCEDWDLLYGEYHLHDKYGRAIRIGRKKRPDAALHSVSTTTPLVTETTRTVTVYRTMTNVYEESLLASNPLLWVLVALLLLLLILRRTRHQTQKP